MSPNRFLALGLALAASPLPAAPRVLTDVAYLGATRTEKLDLYLPDPGSAGAEAPAVVWIHGGALTGGDKHGQREVNFGRNLSEAGYVVASINYRLGKGAWPQDIADAKNAVRFLRARAADYGIDPKRIAVAGGSAGGYLALMVGFTPDRGWFDPGALYPGVSDRVSAVVDFYGTADYTTRRAVAKDGTVTAERRGKITDSPQVFGAPGDGWGDPIFVAASPVNYVSADSPPVLICQGRIDPEVDYLQAVELARVLSEHGVPHQLLLMDGVGHSFDLQTWKKKPLPHALRPVVLSFLGWYLGKS